MKQEATDRADKVQGHPNKGLKTPHPVTGKYSKKMKK